MERTRELRPASVLAGVMAVAAAAGAVGLWAGGIDFGEEVTARLPWGSTLLAGTALLLVVAVPMGLAAVAAWRAAPRAPELLVVAGLLLVAWIAVELAFIRSLSWLQPVCLVWGLVVALWGRHAARTVGPRPEPGVSPGRTRGAHRT